MGRSRPDKNLGSSRVAIGLVILGLVALDPGGWAVFAPVKWMVVTAGTAILALAITTWRVHRRSVYMWSAFLGWGVVVSIVAVDPLYTWFGTPDRHLGLVAWLVFAILFFAGQALTYASGTAWIRTAAVAAGVLIGGVAVFEWIGVELVMLSDTSSRLGATLGSPAYLGAALTLLIPLNIAAAADSSGTPGWRVAASAVSVLCVVTAVGAQSRAALVGLVVAAVVTLPAWRPWFTRRALLATGFVLVFVLAMLASPFSNRLAATFDPESGTARARIDEWRTGVAGFREHPIMGVGFEGYRVVFPAVVAGEYERRYGRSVIPDRAHNGALDVAITTGIPGVAIYLFGAVWLVTRARRAIRHGTGIEIGIAAAIVAYVVQQQLLFPLAEVDPTFWLIAGALVCVTSNEAETVAFEKPALATGALAILAVTGLWFGGRDVVADRRVASALSAESQVAAVLLTSEAVDLRSDSIRYWFVSARVSAAAGDIAGIDDGLRLVESGRRRSPGDPALLELEAELLVLRADETGRSSDIRAALEAWRWLTDLDPNNAGHRFQYGSVLVRVGELAGAEAELLLASDLAPNNPAPVISLSLLYLDLGRISEASAYLDRLIVINPDHPAIAELESRIAEGM